MKSIARKKKNSTFNIMNHKKASQGSEEEEIHQVISLEAMLWFFLMKPKEAGYF